jgi:hypothetical protein
MIKFSRDERKSYDKYIEDLRYEMSMVESNFEAGLVEGKKEGFEEGQRVGMERWMLAGEKIGADKTKIEMAKKM